MDISVGNNRGKCWKKFGNSYVKGFAFIGNKLLKEKEIYAGIINSIKDDRLNDELLNLNGNFSAIIDYDNSKYL